MYMERFSKIRLVIVITITRLEFSINLITTVLLNITISLLIYVRIGLVRRIPMNLTKHF